MINWAASCDAPVEDGIFMQLVVAHPCASEESTDLSTASLRLKEAEEFAKKSKGVGLISHMEEGSVKAWDSLKKSSEEMVSVTE